MLIIITLGFNEKIEISNIIKEVIIKIVSIDKEWWLFLVMNEFTYIKKIPTKFKIAIRNNISIFFFIL